MEPSNFTSIEYEVKLPEPSNNICMAMATVKLKHNNNYEINIIVSLITIYERNITIQYFIYIISREISTIYRV